MVPRNLVEQAKENRPDAICKLYERYQPAAMRLAMRMLGNREIAMDVVQDAFLVIYVNFDKIQPPAFRSFLLTTVTHKCLHARSRVRTIPWDDLKELGDGEDLVVTVLDQVSFDAMIAKERGLTEERRAMLILRYGEGYTVEEIADARHVTPGAVKRGLRCAMKLVRRRLGGGN